MKEFIALHNRTVSRHEIQTVIALAKEQNNTEVIYRLSKILNDHPDSNRFNINIINYPQETDNQAGLAGTRHSGDYREALDECGRLKKGWHFVDGKVVKVQKRSGLLSQYTEKEFGHPFTKTLKAKFKELNWKYDRKNKRYYTPVPENEAEKEQQAQMFAFIEQEKSRIEANGNFPSTPSSAKSAPSAPSSNKNTPTKNYTAESFAKDLDYNTLKRSYSWISFDPDARAERDIKQWGEIFYSLYNSLSEEAKKQGVLEAYNTAFDNGYTALLKLEKEIIATRSKTFSTAITGGAGITEKQVSTNEKRMRQQSEKSELWNQKYDKLHKILEKIAKNKPADLYEEGDVIKSTDNNAMTKLQQKLKMLQDRKTMLKNGVVAAKEYQKNKDLSVFKKYNIDKETTETIVKHIDNGGSPTEKGMYNWFTMPYLNRDIKEVEKRIAILEKNQSQGEKEILIEGGKIVHNGEAQRLQIFFDGIPSKEVREALKSHAFKWAPTAKAWQRTLTENAKYAVNQYLIKTGILKLRTALSAPHQEDEIAFLSAAGIDYFPEAPDDEAQGLGKPVPAADIYKMITDKIVSMLKSTKASDYKKTWKDDAFFIPLNFDSKKPYRGVNRMLLQERIGLTEAFANPYFLTFKQIKKHKGTLKKGAKGYEVVYYSIRYVVPADKNSGRKAYSSTNAQKVLDFLHKYNLPESEVTRIPMIRYYNVYNGADIENIDFKLDELEIGRAVPDSATENQAAQLIVENYPNPPAIKHGGNEAYYKLSEDLVRMPKIEQFDSVNDYYRTLFHELTHSTRHENRLNREKISFRFGDTGYAKEELVAEFGAVFLSAWAGIMWYNNKNHAAYLKGWNSAIKEAQNDNKFLMRAASLAQQATDYILALDNEGNPAFLKKLQGKKATKKSPKTPTDKSAPSDTESYFLQREEQVKRAELIRIARKQGHTEEEIRQRAKKLGYDNIDLLINLSYLNPKGEISSAYIYYPDNETPTITKMVNWVGEARRKYSFLEDEHEQQFFDLYDQQFYEKKDKKYLFEKIEELASKYHSFEELMKKHNIKGNVFFFDKLIAAVKVSLRKSNYKEVPDWYIRYSVPIDTDEPLTKENKDFLKKYFVAEVSKVVKPFALKEKYTTWVEFKQKGLELLSKIITPSAKSEKSNSSPKIPALGFLFGKYPEISTDTFKDMKVSELRAFTLSYYLTHLKGKKVAIKNHLKEVIFTTKAGRKIAKGEAMYKEKAAVIEHLEELIKNSTYNNWGSRKTQDNPNILGYLNFKSKITIDGEKRHVRIAISLTRERKTELKNVEVGKKKSASFRKATVVNPQDGRNETLSTESVAKTVPNSALSAPEVFVEHSPDPATPSITPRNNTLAAKMATLQNRTFETFIIAEPQMQAFLGDVERKNTGSTAITITGGAGSGKTRFAFQFINALAQNYKVGHASLEEQPDSKLYFDKVQQYLDQTAQANVEAPEIENMQDLQALIERNDVIVIDSFTKIREWDRNFLLDRDLRKKYNGKLFLIIFQQTVAGNMRGGTTSEFDGDIILYTQVFPDYRENYIYPSKNRYNSTPSEQLRYSVYHQQLLPSESTPPNSSPVTSNTYEIIY